MEERLAPLGSTVRGECSAASVKVMDRMVQSPEAAITRVCVEDESNAGLF